MYIKDDIPFCIVPFGPAGLEIIFVSVFCCLTIEGFAWVLSTDPLR